MRSVVVVLDSLNVLLEQTSLQKVLLFLRELRQKPHIGSVVVRVNTSAVSGASRQVLASEATAVAQVETPTSLNAYPILAKERRRELPKNMHGFVLLQRLKKVSCRGVCVCVLSWIALRCCGLMRWQLVLTA